MARKATKATPKKGKARRDWKPLFLAALSDCGVVTRSCRAAGINKKTAYSRRDVDPEFARSWDDAIEESIEGAEAELYRRAVKGTLKPIYQGGVEVGQVREFSDTCLIFMLKANRPEKYREPKGDTVVHVEARTVDPGAAKAAMRAAAEHAAKGVDPDG